MSTLNRKFNEDLVITKKRLDETRALVNKEIAGLTNNVLIFWTLSRSMAIVVLFMLFVSHFVFIRK